MALTDREQLIAGRILREIQERLRFLTDVGVGYLTLGRSAATLSGGEGQRIRLATQIGASLRGVLYVLDEPSIGLHQRDNRRLLTTLRRLRDLGNSVIVVEHDEETIRTADYLVDLGPGAGEHGGHVIFQGPPQQLLQRRHPLAHRRVPPRRADHRDAACAAGARARGTGHPRRARQQPQEHRRPHPARRVHRRSPASAVRGSRRSSTTSSTARSPRCSIARPTTRARTRGSTGSNWWTRSSRSTSRRSAGRRVRTPPPTPACSPSSANCSRCCPRRRRAASSPGASRSTSRAAAARAARATASSPSRCTSCRTCT